MKKTLISLMLFGIDSKTGKSKFSSASTTAVFVNDLSLKNFLLSKSPNNFDWPTNLFAPIIFIFFSCKNLSVT